MDTPVRILIGCSANERLPADVLAHTVREHCSREVEIKYLYEHIKPLPPITRSDARPRTAFSYSRFQIPEICGYKGRAIYLDSDQIVFADIAELFDAPMLPGQNIISACPLGKPHQNSSVMCIDCEKTPWDIEQLVRRINTGTLTYSDIMRLQNIGVTWGEADHNWNCLDSWTPQTKLLHFTDMGRQPWLPGKTHPLGHLWFAAKARMEAANVKA